MIVETNAITTIGVGAQKTVTEPGDTTLKIPNLLFPSLELQDPTTVFIDTNVAQVSSFCANRFVSRNNSASGAFLLATIAKGYWEFSFSWAMKTTFAAPFPFNAAVDRLDLISPIGGVSAALMVMLPYQNGSLQQNHVCRLLLRDNAQLSLAFSATGAADFLDSWISLQARKLL